jgi:hypothetical protein
MGSPAAMTMIISTPLHGSIDMPAKEHIPDAGLCAEFDRCSMQHAECSNHYSIPQVKQAYRFLALDLLPRGSCGNVSIRPG